MATRMASKDVVYAESDSDAEMSVDTSEEEGGDPDYAEGGAAGGGGPSKKATAVDTKGKQADKSMQEGAEAVPDDPATGEGKKKKTPKIRVWADLPDWGDSQKCPFGTLPAEVIDIILRDDCLKLYDHLSLACVNKAFLNAYTNDVFASLLIRYPESSSAQSHARRPRFPAYERVLLNGQWILRAKTIVPAKPDSTSILDHIFSRAPSQSLTTDPQPGSSAAKPASEAGGAGNMQTETTSTSSAGPSVTSPAVGSASTGEPTEAGATTTNNKRQRSTRNAFTKATVKMSEIKALEDAPSDTEEEDKAKSKRRKRIPFHERLRLEEAAKPIKLSENHRKAIDQNNRELLTKGNVHSQFKARRTDILSNACVLSMHLHEQISESELLSISPFIVKNNPRFPTKGKMRLYRYSDVEQLAFRARGGEEGHQAHLERVAAKAKKAADTREKNGTKKVKSRSKYYGWGYGYGYGHDGTGNYGPRYSAYDNDWW